MVLCKEVTLRAVPQHAGFHIYRCKGPAYAACSDIYLRDCAVASKQPCLPAGDHINAFVHAVKVDLQQDVILSQQLDSTAPFMCDVSQRPGDAAPQQGHVHDHT